MRNKKSLIRVIFISSLIFLACIFTLLKSQEKLPQKPTHIKLITGETVDITKMTFSLPQRKVMSDIDAQDAFSFENKHNPGFGLIRYKLTEPAKVNIRIVSKKDPHIIYRELLNWEYRDVGEHVEKWDGRDVSGYAVLRDDAMIRIRYEPINLAIPAYDANIILNDPDHRWGHLHILHDIDKCGQFELEFVRPTKDDVILDMLDVAERRVLVINPNLVARIPFEIRLKGNFKGYSEKWGFGARWTLDDQEVVDQDINPDKISGYLSGRNTFRMDLSVDQLEDGKHTIAFRLCDHNDHIGILRLVIHVDRNSRKP